MAEEENNKPYKIKDVTRAVKKSLVASTLDEVRRKSAEKFDKIDLPNIHLDCDGTEIDDEDYFQTLEPNTELIAVFPGEDWIDPTHYVTITTHRNSDTTDGSYAEVQRIHLKKLVEQMKSNICNVSVLSEPDLELLSNMDPNHVADVTGKDFIEQLKEASGRLLYEKRQAFDAINLLKLIAREKSLSSSPLTSTTTTLSSSSNSSSMPTTAKTTYSIERPGTSDTSDQSDQTNL